MEHNFYVGQLVRIKKGALAGGDKDLIGKVFPIRNICYSVVDLDIPGDPVEVMDYYYFEEIEPVQETELRKGDELIYEIVGQRHGGEEALAETKELQNAMDLVIAANLGLYNPHNGLKYYGFYHRVKENNNG